MFSKSPQYQKCTDFLRWQSVRAWPPVTSKPVTRSVHRGPGEPTERSQSGPGGRSASTACAATSGRRSSLNFKACPQPSQLTELFFGQHPPCKATRPLASSCGRSKFMSTVYVPNLTIMSIIALRGCPRVSRTTDVRFTVSVKHELGILHIIFEDDTAIIRKSCFVNATTEDAATLLGRAVGHWQRQHCWLRHKRRTQSTDLFGEHKVVSHPRHHRLNNVLGTLAGHPCLSSF